MQIPTNIKYVGDFFMQEIKKREMKEASGEYERSISVKSSSYYINIPRPWAKAKRLINGNKLKIITFDDHFEVWIKENTT